MSAGTRWLHSTIIKSPTRISELGILLMCVDNEEVEEEEAEREEEDVEREEVRKEYLVDEVAGTNFLYF